MKLQIGFVCVSFFFLSLFLLGLFNFLINPEPNRCNMTFMYEFPQLIRVTLPSEIRRNYTKYGLYAYGEGRNIHRVREMKFYGVPVLFIPGNRGSPKQVRSLASVSLSKAQHSRVPFHLDYFAVDLNEDFSGLYGGFLKEQTVFVNICLKRILDLYRRDDKPKSIIIIAHSMGGMIAKGLFLEPNFNAGTVKLIITLATPHHPALLADHLIADYYKSVNTFWDNFNASDNGVNLISIGGGPKDLLVRSDLTLTKHADINVVTSLVPGVWMSVDHLCILWCNQLVVTLVRALFDVVDINTLQLTEDTSVRKKIFTYHLLERSAGKSYHTSQFPESVTFLNNAATGKWIEVTGRSMNWSEEGGVTKPTHIFFSLATPFDGVAIQSTNHETRDWIFACVFDSIVDGKKICKEGINLSSKGRISQPTNGFKKKTALLYLSHLRKEHFTHVVIRTLPTKEPVQIVLDLFRKRDRIITGSTFLNFKTVIIPKTETNEIFYSIKLLELTRYWHSYRVHVKPTKGCHLSTFGEVLASTSWSNDGGAKLLRGIADTADFPLLTARPITNDSVASFELFLDPKCTYQISLERPISMGLGWVVSRTGSMLVAHIACCLLFCIAYQTKCLGSEGECPLLQLVLPVAAKPYFIIQASALAATFLQSLAKVLPFLPDTDVKIQSGFVELIVIPFFLHLTAFCFTFICATGTLVSVALQGQAFNGLFLKFVKRYSLGLNWLSEYIVSGLGKVPVVVSAFMITVASSASGGLALAIGLFFYFFKLISLYEDFWEEVVYWPLKYLKWMLKSRRRQNEEETEVAPAFKLPPILDISFHLSLILLWAVSTIISIPSILVWAKNYKYNTHLEPDPSFHNAVVMSVCAGILWQSELPKVKLQWGRQVGYGLVVLGVLAMVYGQTNLYRIPYLISAGFLLVTCHQVIVPLLYQQEAAVEDTNDSNVQSLPITDREQAGTSHLQEEDAEETKEEAIQLSSDTIQCQCDMMQKGGEKSDNGAAPSGDGLLSNDCADDDVDDTALKHANKKEEVLSD